MAPLCHLLNCYNSKSYLQSILSVLRLCTAVSSTTSDSPEQEICPQVRGICATSTTGAPHAAEERARTILRAGFVLPEAPWRNGEMAVMTKKSF